MTGPFAAILADPPWSFRVWNRDTGHGRSAESHYRTLPLGELASLPVGRLAAPDSALFLWAVMPSLPDAIALGQAWGFRYRTVAFTWAKTTARGRWHFGLGYWTRANAEVCLLFTRGRPRRIARNVPQLIVAPVGAHSAKPDEQYARIERLVAGPYVELFARTARPGWTAIGNAIDGRDIRDVLNEGRMNEYPPVNGPFRGLIVALSALAVFGCGCGLTVVWFFHWLGGV